MASNFVTPKYFESISTSPDELSKFIIQTFFIYNGGGIEDTSDDSFKTRFAAVYELFKNFFDFCKAYLITIESKCTLLHILILLHRYNVTGTTKQSILTENEILSKTREEKAERYPTYTELCTFVESEVVSASFDSPPFAVASIDIKTCSKVTKFLQQHYLANYRLWRYIFSIRKLLTIKCKQPIEIVAFDGKYDRYSLTGAIQIIPPKEPSPEEFVHMEVISSLQNPEEREKSVENLEDETSKKVIKKLPSMLENVTTIDGLAEAIEKQTSFEIMKLKESILNSKKEEQTPDQQRSSSRNKGKR